MGSIQILFPFITQGSVYRVGDSPGWTIIGNVDYHSWSSSKTFRVGDTLIFEYDPRFHNVLEVSRSDYHSCDSTAPIANYTSGNDTIVVRWPGHYYYVCGFVGHCQAGQKVDIRVPKPNRPSKDRTGTSLNPSPPEPVDPKPSQIGPLDPSPSPNSGDSESSFMFLYGLIWLLKLMVLLD
ncbi:mavicyanin-like isoform X2 [Andrographis paniculata]|uniref:mavicyanin-like isoform X2 n=1 Tax=Andrographis paniculata TaxID=175694 RepID=UPI0021E9614D|nr:mavicyanin-like isoform X2 [Andrographis paniculata]